MKAIKDAAKFEIRNQKFERIGASAHFFSGFEFRASNFEFFGRGYRAL